MEGGSNGSVIEAEAGDGHRAEEEPDAPSARSPASPFEERRATVKGLAHALGGSIRFGPPPLHRHTVEDERRSKSVHGGGEDDSSSTGEGSDDGEENDAHSSASVEPEEEKKNGHGGAKERGDDNAAEDVEDVAGDDGDENPLLKDPPTHHSIRRPQQPKGGLGDINIARELKINQRLTEQKLARPKPTTEFKLKHDKVRNSVKRQPQDELSTKLGDRRKREEEQGVQAATVSNTSELQAAFSKFRSTAHS